MKRVNYIDIARAIAMFIIVFGHSIVYSTHCVVIYRVLYSFNVVLFFILSGMTFNSKNKTILSFSKNKFKRIVVPYFIWAVLFIIPFLILGKGVSSSNNVSASFDLKHCIIDTLYGTAFNNRLKQNAPLWFLPALFSCNILAFVFKMIFDKLKIKDRYILFITFIISLLSILFIKYPLPFGLSVSFQMLFFFYSGYFLNKYNIFQKYNGLLLTFFLLTIGIVFAIINGQVGIVNLKYSNIFYFLISSLSISFAIIAFSYSINSNSIIEYVGRNTLSILIFHKIIVLIFQTKLGFITKILIDSNVFYEVLVGIIISIISIVFCLIMGIIFEKTFPIFIGKEKNKINADFS